MAIISYSKTLDEYLQGKKTCTRRYWKKTHMERWQQYWHDGKHVHDAWSALPFVGDARKLGQFRLLCCPYWERLSDMPYTDLISEGEMCKTLDEFYELIDLQPDRVVAVVRFIPLHLPKSAQASLRLWEVFHGLALRI